VLTERAARCDGRTLNDCEGLVVGCSDLVGGKERVVEVWLGFGGDEEGVATACVGFVGDEERLEG
jgi:hypothetical protein